MHLNSHTPMRSRFVIPRQRPGKPREQVCIRAARPGRGNDQRKAIAESWGLR
jgi:hypothetical protein